MAVTDLRGRSGLYCITPGLPDTAASSVYGCIGPTTDHRIPGHCLDSRILPYDRESTVPFPALLLPDEVCPPDPRLDGDGGSHTSSVPDTHRNIRVCPRPRSTVANPTLAFEPCSESRTPIHGIRILSPNDI